MQYELRYQVIEPKRNTYQNVIDRLGDQPATRYQEATLDVEPRENFHYRPTWAQDRELYDPRYSALRLTDPYSFAEQVRRSTVTSSQKSATRQKEQLNKEEASYGCVTICEFFPLQRSFF